MASLSAAAICVLCAAQPGHTPQIAQWQPTITEASARFGIPEDWIARVMQVESGGRTTLNGKPIASVSGAMGLMQLMPGSFADMRRRYGLGPDPYDSRANILAGTAYLRVLFDRYGYPDLFAAYHAGPGRFEAFLRQGRPLPEATIAYLNRIVPGRFAASDVANAAQDHAFPTVKSPSGSPLFFVTGRGHRSTTPTAGTRFGGVPIGSSSVRIRSSGTELLFSGECDLFVPLSTPAR